MATPRTAWILCLGHEETLVRIATVDVEPSVMVADGWFYIYNNKKSVAK